MIPDRFLKYADPQPPKALSFREQFLATPPGPARENLVYNAAISQPLPKLVPITVTGPNGIKITYKVLPDYLNIDGIRVPMTGATAQRIANHFGMHLPTTKMSKQIWDAAGTKVNPTPMSAGANIGGKWYSGQEVVDSKISSSDTSVAFNDKIDQEIDNQKQTPKNRLIAGHMKDIVAPEYASDKLGLYGWYDKSGKPIQGGNGVTPHDINQHTEYASGARLVSDTFTITDPNGKKIGPITMQELLTNPAYSQYAKMVANKTGTGPVTYETGKSQTKKPGTGKPAPSQPKTYTPEKPKSGRSQFLERINSFLDSISNMF